ncbi:MAG: type II toxin-antitoxin system RelE/ParE family toxin [Pseudonocardiaceae bacterium]
MSEGDLLLGEPYRRQLDGKLRELRFHIDRRSVRVTYWIATGRRIVLLTVFAKSRMREDREIERARKALARCIAEEHMAEEGNDGGAGCGHCVRGGPARVRAWCCCPRTSDGARVESG